MRLTPEEVQTLIGPAAMGVVVGALLALGEVALASEQNSGLGNQSSASGVVLHAFASFVAGMLATAGILGVLPIVIGRYRSRKTMKD